MSRSPQERTIDAQMFGRPVSFDYSETWVAYSIVLLRVVMAWIFLQAGVDKLLADDWSAAGYLDPSTPYGVGEANPLSGMFADMAANAGMIDPLVIFGQLLIGLALLLGVLVRFAVFWGAVQMVLFWLAALQGGLAEGLPVEHGWVVNSDIVYLIILFGLGAWGAGRILGLDATLESHQLVENNPWLKYLLG